jgi:hypothetical protein
LYELYCILGAHTVIDHEVGQRNHHRPVSAKAAVHQDVFAGPDALMHEVQHLLNLAAAFVCQLYRIGPAIHGAKVAQNWLGHGVINLQVERAHGGIRIGGINAQAAHSPATQERRAREPAH